MLGQWSVWQDDGGRRQRKASMGNDVMSLAGGNDRRSKGNVWNG